MTYDPTAGVEGASFLPEDDLKELKKRKFKEMREQCPANFKVLGDTSEYIDDTELVVTLKLEQETEQDVTDDSQYSIQQSKLRTEEDHRLKLAEKKKEGIREQIEMLKNQFSKLYEKNNTKEAYI